MNQTTVKLKITSAALLMAWSFFALAAPADASKPSALQTVGEWKIYKSDETNYNSCIAKHTAHTNITLSEQKLMLGLKETKDLKTYQISVNDQIVAPFSRANLVDNSCNCVRVRNVSRLNIDNAVIKLEGQDNKDKPVNASVTLKDIPAVLQALKGPACSR
jgi:hypothetical protein